METALKRSKGSSFTSSIGFVLATAGSAVGLGNIWRFPYLAAKGGGGLFLLTYIILAFTFGSTLLITEMAIGRKTGKSPIGAFSAIGKKWKFIGYLSYIVPAIILTYYVVIGGWIIKYFVDSLFMRLGVLATDGYFSSFISSPIMPLVYMAIFMLLTAFIVFNGVEKGIEKSSKYIMPALFILVIFIAIFSLFISHTDEVTGVTRTGLQGFLHYIVPDFRGVTFTSYLEILLSAMGQLFFSLSIAMGILITYGSYARKDMNLNKSIMQVEFFDTLVAFFAGMMVVPAVYVFSGLEGMAAGPSLLFIALPKVFSSMGAFGNVISILFFLMVLFAALTSSVSILETITANSMEVTGKSRKKVSVTLSIVAISIAAIVSLGYSVFYFELPLPTGANNQLLDVFDYFTNSILMPLIALMTCVVIGWVTGPKWITDEMEAGGVKMHRKRFYRVMVKWVAPVMLFMLFLQSTGIINLVSRLFR